MNTSTCSVLLRSAVRRAPGPVMPRSVPSSALGIFGRAVVSVLRDRGDRPYDNDCEA